MPSTTKLETARTFVPGWWMHAFEASIAISASGDANIGVDGSGVLPKFSSSELAFLALLLGDIQRQILESDSADHVVELDWANVQKHLSGADAHSRDRLSHVFESLSQIRFPVLRGESDIIMLPLFTGESWAPGQDGTGAKKLRLQPTPYALELLTGYMDGHLDFLRRVCGHDSLSSTQCGRSPLMLWTPVWLELAVQEQVVYARMETAMQSEGAWLRLDGLVGCSLETLTSGVKLGKKVAEPQSPLMDRLRLVGKLGRRLVAHGVIQREPNSGYMALDADHASMSPVLLWQASSERLRSRAEGEYFGLASMKILRGPISDNIDKLLAIFAAISGSESSTFPILRKIWGATVEVPGFGSIMGPGVTAQAHMLFLEWIARSHPATLLPLPENLRKHPAARLCSSTDAANAPQKFREFVSSLSRAEDLRQSIQPDSLFSVFTGTISKNIMNVCERAVARFAVESHPKSLFLDEKPRIEAQTSEVSVPSISKTVKHETTDDQKVDHLSRNLRRIAQEELDKMIRQSPDSYDDLKSKYIASLDAETKLLVLDVQRRLGSKTFDRHLRIRLVHYMVEHPSSWNSVSSRLPM